jgi:hypothetical protein
MQIIGNNFCKNLKYYEFSPKHHFHTSKNINDRIMESDYLAKTLTIESKAETHHFPLLGKQFSIIDKVKFPSFSGLQCNMMPFIMGEKYSLPKEYQTYWSIIQTCRVPEEERGKVGYLTISESYVLKGSSQRRSGIHVEKHPGRGWGGGGWGGGTGQGSGLYMASTQDKTCRIWDCYIETPGQMGDCGHLKDQLTEPTYLEANSLVWLTDSCPHEALPQEDSGIRQFFRLVTSHVDLWYEAHSTKNPLVDIPANVKIFKENKFNRE